MNKKSCVAIFTPCTVYTSLSIRNIDRWTTYNTHNNSQQKSMKIFNKILTQYIQAVHGHNKRASVIFRITLANIDPENPSLEPDMEWIECTVSEIFAFKLYCDLETGVRGHSRSSKVALFDRAHTTLHSSSIVTMPHCLYLLPFPRYSRILVENCYPSCIWRPRWG